MFPFPTLIRTIHALARKSLMTGPTPVGVWQTLIIAHIEGGSADNITPQLRVPG